MQNGGMLLATTTLFFRVHTRVLLTLFVALAIALLCLTGFARQPASTPSQLAEQAPAPSALPLGSKNSELPRSVIRLFVLLPHLVPHDN